MAKAGGTSVGEPASGGGFFAFVVVAPIAAYLVHRVSSGDECGWDYGAVGGACRAIILLSIIAGIAAGSLATVSARAMRADHGARARNFAIIAIGVVVLATLAARQFQDYRHAGQYTMDDDMCKFVNDKLMSCVRVELGDDAYRMTRKAQDGCLADAPSIEVYRKCMPIADCTELVDCISKGDYRPL